jgi:DNA-directed RNA polymerase specialized sigma24 family protein
MSRVGIENFEYAGQAMNFFQMTIRRKRLDTVRHDKRHPKESYDNPDANFPTPSTRQNIARELEADTLIISILSKSKTQREAVFVVDVLGMTPEDAAEDFGI